MPTSSPQPGPADDHYRGSVSNRTLRRTVALVALLNLAYFFVEAAVAVGIGSVSLLADSVDFLEDAAVNALIFLALGWTLAARARVGKVMALIICLPAVAAIWQAVTKIGAVDAPDPSSMVVTALGAALVNTVCALLLARVRHHGGSLSKAAFLAARNDVAINIAIIAVGVLTAWTTSGWPDLVLGLFVAMINLSAAKEVWEAATEEDLAARAISGELDEP